MREYLGIEPDALDDVDWENTCIALIELGLDHECIEMRAAVLMLPPGTPIDSDQLFESGLGPEVVAYRQKWLDLTGKTDPALTLRDTLIAEERRQRGTGSITDVLPTDAATPAYRPGAPERVAPIAGSPVPSVALADQTDLSEHDQRCLAALMRVRQGATHVALAEDLGKDPRTISRWITRAREIERDHFNAARPADILADTNAIMEAKTADLERLYANALAAGSTSQIMAISRELRRWHRMRFDLMHRSGLFNGYMHPAVPASDRDAEMHTIRAL
jgi:hypothetical protein